MNYCSSSSSSSCSSQSAATAATTQDDNVPVGWNMRTVADYTPGETGAPRTNRAEDWRIYELENRHYREEQSRLQRLAKGEKDVDLDLSVPIGWAERDNTKTLQELSMSKNSTNIAVAEVCVKPLNIPTRRTENSTDSTAGSAVAGSGGVAPGSVTINVSAGGFYVANGGIVNMQQPAAGNNSCSNTASSSASTVGKANQPPTPAASASASAAGSAPSGSSVSEIMQLLQTMQQQQQATIGQLATVMMGISDRLSAMEFKVDELVLQQGQQQQHGSSSSSNK